MKENEEKVAEQPSAECDKLTKPTMAPPGGSALGYWDCDKSTKTWVWIDSVA